MLTGIKQYDLEIKKKNTNRKKVDFHSKEYTFFPSSQISSMLICNIKSKRFKK